MQSLAVKYRPKTWDDITEQLNIVKILTKQIETGNIRNAYLFSGASGCGKTTCARIFANVLNNNIGTPIEIDAASNSGVENVRNIIQQASDRALYGEYKIYIIDECHALSNAAWNAMLKIIEEPPKYTIFIFCTTDPQKIPNTILNRVQRYNFTRISSEGINKRLSYICNCENIKYSEDAIDYISRIADGGMREAISLLDKCIAYNNNITIESVLAALGNYSYDIFFNLVNKLLDGEEAAVLEIINYYYNQGNDLKLFVDQFLSFCMDINKYALFKSCKLTKIPSNYIEQIERVINFDQPSKYYNYVVDKLLQLKNTIKNNTNIKEIIEVFFIQITRCVV